MFSRKRNNFFFTLDTLIVNNQCIPAQQETTAFLMSNNLYSHIKILNKLAREGETELHNKNSE